MTFNPDLHHRRSMRLRGYDYTEARAYLVTICTFERQCLFGEIINGEVNLNQNGETVCGCWNAMNAHFPYLSLDSFIVMPNHIHGIIWIVDSEWARHASPLHEQPRGPKSKSVGAIVGSFKSAVTKRINQTREKHGIPVWQRNYYEHIIRDDDDMNRIRGYIEGNPARWAEDEENPTRIKL